MGFRAQAFMDATLSSGESEVAAEFLSHSPYQMWMNSSGEPKAKTCKDCPHAGDNKDYPEMESGGFGDTIDLCTLLKLDGDCLLAPQKSLLSLEIYDAKMDATEDPVSSFYSKIAQ
ncbi:hypothetical protein KI387_041908, partial [Taxus chinensis]